VRGLSGGEKRRVSIGVELLMCPGLMFLDEPTTGLDSTNAAKVVDIISGLSRDAGMSVILSIHQPRPDMLRALGRVLLLSGTGQMVYSGPCDLLESHVAALGFPAPGEGVNVVDYVLDLVIKAPKSDVEAMVIGYLKSETSREEAEVIDSASLASVNVDLSRSGPKYMARTYRQIHMLSLRQLRNALRHPMLILLNFVVTFVTAVVLGGVYYQLDKEMAGIRNRFGCFFFILLFQSIMSLSSLPIWRDQYLVFHQERVARAYSTFSYFVSVAIFDLIPLRMLPPSFFAFFTYWMVGLRSDSVSSVGFFLLILILNNVAAALVCFAVGIISKNNRVAIIVAGSLILVWSLFGSFLIAREKLPPALSWISATSYINYAFEALTINEFSGDDLGYLLSTGIPDQPPLQVTGTRVLEFFGYDAANFGDDLAWISFICVVLAILSYSFLLLTSSYFMSVARMNLSRLLNSGESQQLFVEDVSEEEVFRRSQQSVYGPDSSLTASGAGGKWAGQSVRSTECSPRFTRHLSPRSSNRVYTHPCVDLAWSEVSCEVRLSRSRRRRILTNISGYVGGSLAPEGAALLGLMGPSGAGKTTLLDILAGRLRHGSVGGRIFVNGSLASAASVRRLSGYVAQDDPLPGTATVREHLTFHAVLRMPGDAPTSEKKARVWEVIGQLGLHRVVDSTIGDEFVRGLSGGEKRRVSIGVELLMCPGLMFLDEPTTGLDSTNAAKVVDIISGLSRDAGMSVILSIHQPRPDMLRALGRVLLLSGTGQMVYSGPCDLLESHVAALGFPAPGEGVNVVDYVLDLVIKAPKSDVDRLVEGYRTSAQCRSEQSIQSAVGSGSDRSLVLGGGAAGGPTGLWARARGACARFGREFGMLSLRLLRKIKRHPFLIILNFVLNLVAALAVGFFYRDQGYDTPGIQNRFGSLFFILLFLSFMALSSLPVWIAERRLFLHEVRSASYSSGSYFSSMVVFDMILLRVVPIFLFCASYRMIGLWYQPPARMWWFVLIIMLSNLCAAAVCMCIGAATDSHTIANMVGSFVVLAQLLFGGYLVDNSKLPAAIHWLQYLSFINYAFEALAINEFAGHGYNYTAEGDDAFYLPVEGEDVLKTFGLDPSAFSLDIGVLGLLTALCLAACYAAVFLGASAAQSVQAAPQPRGGPGAPAARPRPRPLAACCPRGAPPAA